VLCYDWRGRGQSTGDFAHTTFETHVDDFGVITSWLRESQGVASDQILGVGFSLGAVVIMKHVARGASIGAIVGWSPAFRPAQDMWPRYNSPELEAAIAATGVARKPGGDDSMLLGRAVLDYLRDTDLGADALAGFAPPALLCHGTGDTRIPHATTEQVAAAAKGRGRGVELVLFPGATHSFRPAEQHHAPLFETTSRWIESHFPAAATAPAPGPPS
jgi:alpha-beta hydrolase superfamily lysophospholipase